MQKEASDVVYSAKNAFFVPLGPVDGGDAWWCIPCPFPDLKRLDVSFDVGDNFENTANTLDCVKSWHDRSDRTPGATPFEDLTDVERWDLLHEEKHDGLFDIWIIKIFAFIDIEDLNLLRLELTNCRCPAGCCRMGLTLLEYSDDTPYYLYPTRIELVGILERDKCPCKEMLTRHGGMPLDHIFFVDSIGCTCKVSPRICCILVWPIDRTLRKEPAATSSPKVPVEVSVQGICRLSIELQGNNLLLKWRSECLPAFQREQISHVYTITHLKQDQSTLSH